MMESKNLWVVVVVAVAVALVVSFTTVSLTGNVIQYGKEKIYTTSETYNKKEVDYMYQKLLAQIDSIKNTLNAVVENVKKNDSAPQVDAPQVNASCAKDMVCARIYKVLDIVDLPGGYDDDYVDLLNLKTGEKVRGYASSQNKINLLLDGKERLIIYRALYDKARSYIEYYPSTTNNAANVTQRVFLQGNLVIEYY